MNAMLLELVKRAVRGNFSSKREEFDQKVEAGLKIKAKGGHFVQSMGEKLIADRLYDCGVPYIYDSLIAVQGRWIRPDFMLPNHDNLLIEFKGMDAESYNEKFQKKLEVLQEAGLKVVVVEPKDLSIINNMIV